MTTSTSRRPTTTTYLLPRMVAVGYVNDHLARGKDWQSITITRRGSSEDFSVFFVTVESSAREVLRFSSQPLLTSPIPLPGKLWDETSLRQAGHLKSEPPAVPTPDAGDVNDQ